MNYLLRNTLLGATVLTLTGSCLYFTSIADDTALSTESAWNGQQTQKPLPDPERLPYDEVIWPWEQKEYFKHNHRPWAINELTSFRGTYAIVDRGKVTSRGPDGFPAPRVGYSYSSYDARKQRRFGPALQGLFMVRSLTTASEAEETLRFLRFLPEIRELSIRLYGDRKAHLRHILHCSYLQRLTLRSAEKREDGKAGDIALTQEDADAILQLRDLQSLTLADAGITDEQFAMLAGMKRIRYLSLYRTDRLPPAIFKTIATWPNITYVTVAEHTGFNAPVDQETARAIASLNGRLKRLAFRLGEDTEEYGTIEYTLVHPTIIPPISKIHSLELLSIGKIEGGATREAVLPLKNLPNHKEVIQYRTFSTLDE